MVTRSTVLEAEIERAEREKRDLQTRMNVVSERLEVLRKIHRELHGEPQEADGTDLAAALAELARASGGVLRFTGVRRVLMRRGLLADDPLAAKDALRFALERGPFIREGKRGEYRYTGE